MKVAFTLFVVLTLVTALVTGCTPLQNQDNSISEQTPASDTQSPVSESKETTALPSGMGMLKVFVTDPPPPQMDAIWVNIKTLEVHNADEGWVTVAENPGKFDLKAIEGIQQYLASQIVKAGKYTQIRLETDNVTIVVGDDEYLAKVPGEKIKLVGGFEVEEGNTTEITLDFNGEKSVTVTGKGEYIFKPVIKLLVEKPNPNKPVITSVEPDSGNQGETLENVIITGANFTGATAVSFGANITINSYTIDSDTQVTANITIAENANLGTRNVSVTTPKGTGVLNDGFTVTTLKPIVTLVIPDSGVRGETLKNVSINGTNFTGATAVSFGANITIDNYHIDTDAVISANITIDIDAILGVRNVSVTTPQGTGILTNGFMVNDQ